ncbi:MAG: DUF1289 domain-containing protein [Alloalcanivorax venustensis]|uniref:DUF1289 domain-containing protein n=1 Tax=Alloalcanivorax venustensis TaxID=172371 RepID=UPI003C48CAD1
MSAFNNRPEFPEAPVSPCVSICALDGDDICVGCFRTGREISYWGLLPVEERREVLVRCQQRMAGEPAPCMVTKEQS